MDAASRANLVVCDYNYSFSEILERFLPRLGRSLDDLVLIVDEAHNLPDRIRGHLGGDLSVHDLLKAAKEARSIDGEVAHRLVGVAKAIEHFLLVVRSERVARKEELLDLVEEGLAKGRGGSLGYTDFVEMVAFAGEDAVRRGLPSALPEVAEFLTRWRDQDVGILRLIVPGHEGKFAFRLMDPSVLSKRVFDRVHASVLMSGTLYPAGMYADLLGIDHARRMIRTYGSPFPKTNRLLLVHPELTTLYAKRSAQMHDRMAQQIAAIAAAVPGNVALFFPSYELLEEAHSRFLALRVGKRILVERPEWTKAQRDGSIEALRVARREGGAVLFAVQGGSLSEGIDYEGNVLAAVVVVGLPLSPPNVEVEALKDYYCRKFGFEKGYDYAYVFPAVNKVLQAAGRPIRSERDRAAIILLEGRLLEPRLARCLPPDFDPRPSREPAPEGRAFLEAPGPTQNRGGRPLRPRPVHGAGQPSSEMDEPFPLFVPDRDVRPKADLVLEETIGSRLRATESTGPALGGTDEPTTDSPPPDVGVDVPALDVADRARVAPVGMGADRRLHEPREASLRTRGHEGHGFFLSQIFVHLFAVSLRVLVRPKGGAQAQPLRSIARDNAADVERLLFLFGHQPPEGQVDERFFSAASHRAACSSNAGRRPSSDERNSWGGQPSKSIARRKRIGSRRSTMRSPGPGSATKRVSWRKPERPAARVRSLSAFNWARKRLSMNVFTGRPRRRSSTKAAPRR